MSALAGGCGLDLLGSTCAFVGVDGDRAPCEWLPVNSDGGSSCDGRVVSEYDGVELYIDHGKYNVWQQMSLRMLMMLMMLLMTML